MRALQLRVFFTLPPEEYPPLPEGSSGTEFRVEAKAFRESASAVTFAASGEEARGAVLMGTLLELEGDQLTLVATDGYRLARYRVPLAERVVSPAKLIVPARGLGEVVRVAGSASSKPPSSAGKPISSCFTRVM